MRKTEIVAWTEKWAELYHVESQKIREVLGDLLLDIHHVGSTSVPAIGYAKPIIDILVIVKDIQQVDSFNDAMMKLGFTPRGENEIPGRRYFIKGGNQRTHHVHMHELGAHDIRKHLDFKAYALAHPEEARKYGELKTKLAVQYPDDTKLYQAAKEDFVKEMVQKALEWAGAEASVCQGDV